MTEPESSGAYSNGLSSEDQDEFAAVELIWELVDQELTNIIESEIVESENEDDTF